MIVMSNMVRAIKRKMRTQKTEGRTNCPKCHTNLTVKMGYGKICEKCGWWQEEGAIKNEQMDKR